MTRSDPHPPSRRTAAEALMCGSSLPAREIAARTGVAYRTLCRWNRQQGWRSPAGARPEGLAPRRRVAIARLHGVEGVDPGDLAEAIGLRRDEAGAFFEACGTSFEAQGTSEARAAQDGTRIAPARAEGDDLRAALRAHVARQIVAFDAELTARSDPGHGDDPRASQAAGTVGAARTVDSARVLRDLAGLKRILDDLDAPQAEAGEPAVDLAALRERLARRIAAVADSRDAPRG